MPLSIVEVCEQSQRDQSGVAFAFTLAIAFFVYLVIDLVVAATAIYSAGKPLQKHIDAHAQSKLHNRFARPTSEIEQTAIR
jgi:hypothetical protein